MPSTIERFVRPLIRWFRAHARDLPWRRTRNPYALWVSEIMLQQTQVKTVLPYWEKWMRNFPTIHSLAAAKPDAVLKSWEGLGYYSRARHLHRAAQLLSARNRGRFPQNYAAIWELPGVGRYTAGAICSIAYNQPTPVLDGNVVRVLTRFFGIQSNARQHRTKQQLWTLAEQLVQGASTLRMGRSCADFNQALMDLGALICTPRSPDCQRCPLRSDCAARRQGLTERLPNLGRRRPVIRRRCTAWVIQHQGRYLIQRRPREGVNGGLWEFPNREVPLDVAHLEWRLPRLIPFPVRDLKPLITLKHSITRYRITLEVFTASPVDDSASNGQNQTWVTLKSMRQLPFPSAHRQIIRELSTRRAR